MTRGHLSRCCRGSRSRASLAFGRGRPGSESSNARLRFLGAVADQGPHHAGKAVPRARFREGEASALGQPLRRLGSQSGRWPCCASSVHPHLCSNDLKMCYPRLWRGQGWCGPAIYPRVSTVVWDISFLPLLTHTSFFPRRREFRKGQFSVTAISTQGLIKCCPVSSQTLLFLPSIHLFHSVHLPVTHRHSG